MALKPMSFQQGALKEFYEGQWDSAKFTMTGPVQKMSFSHSKQRKSVKMLIPDPAM